MNKVWQFLWKDNGTKSIGFVSGTLAAVAGAGVIPEAHLKYYMSVIAVLTFWRGFFNSGQTTVEPTKEVESEVAK